MRNETYRADYKTQLNIEDMTCDPCVRAVKGALERIPGVDRADVGLGAGSATVAGAADVQMMLQAVEAEGYRALSKVSEVTEGVWRDHSDAVVAVLMEALTYQARI